MAAESHDLSLREIRNLIGKWIRQQNKWRAYIENFRRNVTPVEKILAAATNVYPQVYRLQFPMPAQSTADVPDSKRITEGTRFILDRIVASWLVTGAGGLVQNRWWPLASSDPVIASTIAGGAPVTDILDFFWLLRDAGKGRSVSNEPIPGDQLYRHDRDGIMGRYPPVFNGGNELQMTITPTAAPDTAGTLYVCLWGIEARMKPEGIVGV